MRRGRRGQANPTAVANSTAQTSIDANGAVYAAAVSPREMAHPANPASRKRRHEDEELSATKKSRTRQKQLEQLEAPARLQQRQPALNPQPSDTRATSSLPTIVPLTRRNLARFTQSTNMTKKSRNQSRTASTPDERSTQTSRTKTTSTTASGFADAAYKNGVFTAEFSQAPANIEDIQARHAAARDSASPTKSEYDRYVTIMKYAPNEATAMQYAGRHVFKEYEPTYTFASNQAFTGFPQNVGLNNGLSAPQPDYVEGLTKRAFHPVPVGTEFESAVLYADKPGSLVLPHMAGEWKGKQQLAKAEVQSAYDGAALVYSRDEALDYLGQSDPPGHAQVRTFAADGNNINFYAHYAVPSERDPNALEYHQYQYASENLQGSYERYKQGRQGIRNMQDEARATSMRLRDDIKTRWEQKSVPPVVASGGPEAQASLVDKDDEYDDIGAVGATVLPQSSHPDRRGKHRRQDSEEEAPRRSARLGAKKNRGRT